MNAPKLLEDVLRRGHRPGVFLALAGAMLAVGCRTPMPAHGTPVAAVSAQPAGSVRRYEAGRSVEGRCIECIVAGQGGEVVLFLASIHGNECAGTLLLRCLADHLRAHPGLLQGRQVVLVPTANPDGAARGTRANVHGVDLNRNFPAANQLRTDASGQAALSEPESVVIHGLIRRFAPRRIVSLHEPLACVDYDGPGRALAERMSALCGLPVRKLGGRPGSLGSYAGIDQGIPIITLELPPDAAGLAPDALWARYGASLTTAVVYPQ